MALYRALRSLNDGTTRGGITRLRKLEQPDIDKLIKLGAVAPVSTPPLGVFPAWKTRAELLATADIFTVDQLVEAETSALADKVQQKQDEIEHWKTEALALLVVPK